MSYSYLPLPGYLEFYTKASADLGLTYHLPYYNDRQYLAVQPTGEIFLGSRSWVSLLLFFVKGIITLEINGVKITPSAEIMYDIIRYNDICLTLAVATSAIEVNVFTQINVL